MSNDVRHLLHGAATKPSTEPDITGAQRRGRRMRVQRRAMSGVAAVAIVAVGSLAIANLASRGNGNGPAAPSTTSALSCYASSTATTDVPAWADSARPPRAIPHVLSPDGNVIAFLFGDPMAAGENNKILWIVRQPRGGRPLVITATLPGSSARPRHYSKAADSSPGEIYPTTVSVPVPGCWHFALAWNGHHSRIALGYGSVTPKESTTSTTTPTTTTPTSAAATTCHTTDLTVSLGPPNGTAGAINYEIQFRNNAAVPCVMNGYPGVSFVDASGNQTGVPAQRNPIPFAPVTIAPGATAYAHFAVNDLGNPPCSADALQIRVYPPNETAAQLVTIGPTKVCGTSQIAPVLDHSIG